MEDVQEIDSGVEAEARRLLAMAFETAPAGDGRAGSGLAGAELLRGVRRRTTRQRRARALVPAGAVAALGGVAAVAVTLTATVASAPSASAAVTAAAAKTSAGSFRVTMYVTNSPPPPIHISGPVQGARVTGEFDQSRGVGEETVSGLWKFQVRYVGQDMYIDTYPGSRQVIFSASSASKPWAEFPPEPSQTGTAIEVAGDGVGQTPADPMTLLGVLKSAGTVTDEGPASGPGWTGTKYGFTTTVDKTTAAGYVDVDGQGRVRRLVADLTAGGTDHTRKMVLNTEDVTFSDFGAPVTVTAPPASEVYLLKGPVAMISLGW